MVYGYVTTKARYERQMSVVVGLFFGGRENRCCLGFIIIIIIIIYSFI